MRRRSLFVVRIAYGVLRAVDNQSTSPDICVLINLG